MKRVNYGPTTTIKRRSLHGLHSVLGRTGLSDWYARSCRLGGAVILIYHSVAPEDRERWIDPRNHVGLDIFRAHVRFLETRRTVISLAELVRKINAGEPIAAGTVVITFDDGYLDNLDVAFPILRDTGLPATLFLPTRYIDHVEAQWVDVLYSAFTFRSKDRLSVRLSEVETRYNLDTGLDCRKAYGQLSSHLMTAAYEERSRVLACICEQLRPITVMPRLTMSWEDVRRIVSDFHGIDIGSHTLTHLDVTAHPDDVVWKELHESKVELDVKGSRAARFFSFPYSRVSEGAVNMLKSAGYEAAVAHCLDERVHQSAFRYTLPRIEAPASLSRLAFLTSGAYPELSYKLLGRA